MVTTIKITCDGVFIQSNSYLTNSHQIDSASDHNNNISHDNYISSNNTNNLNNANVVNRNRRRSFSSEKDKFTLSFVNQHSAPTSAGILVLRNNKQYNNLSKSNRNNNNNRYNCDIINKTKFLSISTSSLSSASSQSTSSPSPPTTTTTGTSFGKAAINRTNPAALLSSSTSSLLFLPSPVSPATSATKITSTTSNIDVDVKRNRRERERDRIANIKNIPRRNSTGNCFIYNGNGMNSHTAAINLQSSGQTAVVGGGHHRGFPSSVVSSTTTTTDDCPWFMQPGHQLQMPPTAPTRQHKRPAPQPNQNMNSIHAQVHSNNNNNNINQLTSANNKITPIIPTINQQTNTPKSPNQHNNILVPPLLPPSHPLIQQQQQQQQQQQLQQQQQQQNTIMSTSLNSGLLQNHNIGKINLHPVSLNNNLSTTSLTNSGNAASISLSTAPGPNMVQQPNMPPSHIMTSSLHSNTGQFDSNGIPWNSSTSLVTATPATSTMGKKKCDFILNAMPWFHGKITREEAENLLQPREDGLFLVRESTNFPGDYTLCVCFKTKVDHYRVKDLNNQLTIDDEEYFKDLEQLVQHYEKDADGLCTQLIKCVPKEVHEQQPYNGRYIDEKDLQIQECIGKGEFSDVMLGILDNTKVAVKALKDAAEYKRKFFAEASVMTTLKHENLVKFIGLVYNSQKIYLVTEYMSKGSLVDYLRSRGRQHITKKDQINFAYDTCAGMEYLEAKKVIHRDLAARNVLIADNCVAKVSDFGLAQQGCLKSEIDVGKLPIKWTAPEALKTGSFSNKSDMWSFGILLWEIYSFGRVPYPRIPLADVVKHVEIGYRMESPEGCPSDVYEMMTQAWNLEAGKRPCFQDLRLKLEQIHVATTQASA